MRGINHKFENLLDHPNGTTFLTPNAPYYNNYDYFEDDPNENHEFDHGEPWPFIVYIWLPQCHI
jgi:hypothetical protein